MYIYNSKIVKINCLYKKLVQHWTVDTVDKHVWGVLWLVARNSKGKHGTDDKKQQGYT
jgi:hypothetical protein